MARKEIALDVSVNGADAADDRINALDSSIKDLSDSIKTMNGKMETGFKGAKNGADAAAKGVKGFAGSIGGLLKSLGLIAVAMEVFNFLKELLMKNQKVADGLAKAFTAIEIIFNNVAVAVENLITDLRSLSSFSLKDIWNAITNFGSAVSKAGDGALDLANKLVKLRNEVKLAEAEQQKLLYQYQREAEVQRQIRDDVSRTIEERQAANKKLGEILDEQVSEEMKLANKRKELADLELSMNKDNIDAKINVINAEKEIADLQERITGQRSEQLVNENSLKKESIELSKQRAEALRLEAEAEVEAAFKVAEAKANAQKILDDYLAARESLSREEMIQKEIDDALAVEEAKFQAAVQAAQEQGVLFEELDNIELAREEERLRIENEIRAKYYQEDVDLQENIKNEIAKINKERTDDAKAQAEARRKADIENAFMTLNALQSISGSLQQLGVQNTSFAKTLAVSEIAINAAIAVSAAIKNATSSSATVWDMIANIAVAVGTVTAAIASASQILNSAPIPGATSSVSANVPTPTISPVTTNTTQLGNTTQAQLAPIQAFVVETQLTGTQQNINQIQSQATFGFG